MPNPTLLAIAHGSRDPRFARNARMLVEQIRLIRPDLDVRLAFLEFSEPSLAEVLREMSASGVEDAIAVPLLLADAYHARIDLPTVLEGAPSGLRVRQAPVLGADWRLVELARRRITEAGFGGPGTGVILTAVGSSDTTANTRTCALSPRLLAPTDWVGAATVFATGARAPGMCATVGQAAQVLSQRGATELVVAPWFLAPGLLLDRVHDDAYRAGIPMAAPLGADRLVAEVVLTRYADTAAARQPLVATSR